MKKRGFQNPDEGRRKEAGGTHFLLQSNSKLTEGKFREP